MKAQVLTMLVLILLKKYFGVLCESLIYLFQPALQKEVILDDLEIEKVSPIYKTGDDSDLSNYRPMSALHAFPRFLNV